MSIYVMTHVWGHSGQSLGSLLVLLAIADHAHSDGSGAYPSIATLAKMSRLSDRQVQRVIAKLQQDGELVVAYGEGPYRTNVYRVIMDGDNMSGVTTGTPSQAQEGGAGVTQSVNEPFKKIKRRIPEKREWKTDELWQKLGVDGVNALRDKHPALNLHDQATMWQRWVAEVGGVQIPANSFTNWLDIAQQKYDRNGESVQANGRKPAFSKTRGGVAPDARNKSEYLKYEQVSPAMREALRRKEGL